METKPTTEAPRAPDPPRRFVSSVPLSQPSRRSQALTWTVVGVAVAAIAVVVALLSTSGAALWFTH